MTGRTLGHYQILEELGSGGMGHVYKARDTRLNRLVAIKVLRSDRGAPSIHLIQEARAASALNHPNIVTIYDFFEYEGMECLVMEYLAGKTLTALIRRQGLRLKDSLKIAVQVAEGLGKAHQAGIVHRDVKPSNVMVEDGGRVKILDFGLSKLADTGKLSEDEATRTVNQEGPEGAVMGTVNYMSPEQAQGLPVDWRSDIFSFGSTLYEMLAGQRAFRAQSTVGTLAAVLQSEPAPLPAPGIPQPLSRILFKCLEKNPDDRWQSMADVKLMLEDVAKDCETVAPGAQSKRRFGWPVAVSICAAAALLALGAFRMLPSGASSSMEDGAVLRMVTADSGLSGFPAISRDGKLIAFASDRAGEDNLDIWLQQTGSQAPIRLTKDPADESDPAFSPDGTTIAFRSEKNGGGIYTMSALGGSPVLLAPLGRNPRFSPDGKWVAYSVGGRAVSNPGSAGVFIVSSGGGAPRAIHPEMATATDPIWSPGSDRLLVSGRRDGKAPPRSEIDWWILPIEGGTPKRIGAYARIIDTQGLKFPEDYTAAYEWRDGDRLLFTGFLGEAANLWEFPLAGKGLARRLTLGPGTHGHAGWSGDGHRLVFAAEELNYNVWLQPLDARTGASSGAMKQLTEGTSDELAPSISWDARKVAWMSHSGNWSLRVRDNESGGEQTILSSATKLRGARLSGDGTRIVYTNDGYDLLSIPSAGGAAEKLCERCGEAMGASTEGREALYEPMENEDVLMYDAARHATAKLAIRPSPELILSGSRFSRDGKWVAFHALHNATNTAQIWIAAFVSGAAPVPQTEWIAVTDGTKLERDPAWSADGRFLYFISERDGFRCIWGVALNPATKKPSGEPFAVRHFHSARLSLRHVGNLGFLTGLTAGEGALVFSIGELKGNVWLEENGKQDSHK